MINMIAAEVGGWIALGVGSVTALGAYLATTRQARTTTAPVEQTVVFTAYKTLFEQLQVEVGRLHVEVVSLRTEADAARAAEEECHKATAELRVEIEMGRRARDEMRARIAALEAAQQ